MRHRFPSLIKTPRHKRFNYKPMYYDAEQEEIRQRIEEAKRRVEAENRPAGDVTSETVRLKLSDEWRRKSRKSASQQSNMRVAMIAGLLFILFYLYLFVF